ncbi:MAG: hypothetical protein WKG00_11855 [Polyangiaceae bacterium]
MTLRRWAFVALPVAALAAGYSGCTADVEEGCLTGPCGEVTSAAGTGGSVSSSTSGGAGGAGGTGGGVVCQGDEFGGTGDLPCEVWQVLHDKCHCCHQDPPKNFAPFPLLTYELTREPFGTKGLLRWQRMSQVIQDDGLPSMPLATAADLTASEKQVLDEWFAACAPPAAKYKGGVDGCEESEAPPTMCQAP